MSERRGRWPLWLSAAQLIDRNYARVLKRHDSWKSVNWRGPIGDMKTSFTDRPWA